MSSECPICNGLASLNEICPNCGSPMDDYGKASDYTDPYNPYEEAQISAEDAITGDGSCIHFLQCPNCNEIKDHAVNRSDI